MSIDIPNDISIHYSSGTVNFIILKIHNKLLQAGLYLEKKHPKGILNKYKILDKILMGIEQEWDNPKIISEFNLKQEQVEQIRELIKRSQHLREFPPSPSF